MTPAEKAAKAYAAFGVLRDHKDEVARYARSLADAHVLELPCSNPGPSGSADDTLEVTSPAELNERLLKALFGMWPPR